MGEFPGYRLGYARKYGVTCGPGQSFELKGVYMLVRFVCVSASAGIGGLMAAHANCWGDVCFGLSVQDGELGGIWGWG